MLLIKKDSWRLLLTYEAAVLVKHVHWLTPNTDLGQPLHRVQLSGIFTYLDTLWSHCVRITDILLYITIVWVLKMGVAKYAHCLPPPSETSSMTCVCEELMPSVLVNPLTPVNAFMHAHTQTRSLF